MSDASEKTWDVVVIGGGPAGMMAAATAAANGADVLLLEKNELLGKKLRITGGGRCNITNNKPDVREMLSMYKDKAKFLFSTFSQHGVTESVSWFSQREMKLKEENEGRLFPISESAEQVCETMISELKKQNVCVASNAATTDVKKVGDYIHVVTTDKTYTTKRSIVATGGTSRPDTGSTGDGFKWAKDLGHKINSHNVALVPVITKEMWVPKLSGVSLPDVKLRVCVDGERVLVERGKVLFTHTGLSGPTILNMSKKISDLLETGTVTVHLRLLPDLDEGAIRKTLTTLFHEHSNKKVRNVLPEIIVGSIANTLLSLAEVNPDTPCHSVRVEEKKRLATLLFDLPITITGLLGTDKAIISAGGVATEEVDFKTMESKITPGVYFVGDTLDIDRPSGGYSLQLCWSTGYVAGVHASQD